MGEDFSVVVWCVGPSGISMVLLVVHCPLEMVVSIILDPLILLESIVHRWYIQMFLGPQEHRELEAKYALEGCESSSRLTEGVLQVLGPGEKSVPGVLVAMAEGYERIPQFLVTSSSSARLNTDDIQKRGSWPPLGG